jgi:hypothetical protein
MVPWATPMDDKDERYQRAADHCLQMALNENDDRYRVSWLNLAQGWLQMIPPDQIKIAEWTFDAVSRSKAPYANGAGSTH